MTKSAVVGVVGLVSLYIFVPILFALMGANGVKPIVAVVVLGLMITSATLWLYTRLRRNQ